MASSAALIAAGLACGDRATETAVIERAANEAKEHRRVTLIWAFKPPDCLDCATPYTLLREAERVYAPRGLNVLYVTTLQDSVAVQTFFRMQRLKGERRFVSQAMLEATIGQSNRAALIVVAPNGVRRRVAYDPEATATLAQAASQIRGLLDSVVPAR